MHQHTQRVLKPPQQFSLSARLPALRELDFFFFLPQGVSEGPRGKAIGIGSCARNQPNDSSCKEIF